ncbi:MAG: hypothetical protein QXQ77_00715 [Candidatus Aenigmatarchaeota archaeon]
MSRKVHLLFLFLIFFLSLAVSVKAQESLPSPASLNVSYFWSVEYFWKEVFGLPEEWMPTQNIRNFIFNFMVPFLALYAIILGILRQLRIFWRTPAIEIVVAFAFAFSTLPSKAFITYVYLTMALGTVIAYTIFLILFIGGWWLYSLTYLRRKRVIAESYKVYKKGVESLEKQLEGIRAEISSVQREMLLADPKQDLTPYIKKIEKLRKQEEDIIKKLNAIKLSTRI